MLRSGFLKFTINFIYAILIVGGSTPAWSMSCLAASTPSRHTKVISLSQTGLWSSAIQCRNICYFESFVDHLEAELSRQFQRPIAVSRGQIFGMLLRSRIGKRLEAIERLPFGEESRIFEETLVNYGTSQEMADLVNHFGEIDTFDMSQKTRSFMSAETKLMYELLEKIEIVFLGLAKGKFVPRELLVVGLKSLIADYQQTFLDRISNTQKMQISLEGSQQFQAELQEITNEDLSDLVVKAVAEEKTLIATLPLYSGDIYLDSVLVLTDRKKQLYGIHLLNVVGYEADGLDVKKVIFRDSRIEIPAITIPIKILRDRITNISSMKAKVTLVAD